MQIQFRYHGVVHFEQHAQPVALARQLPLVGLGALEIERVIDRHGHLPSHLLKQRDFAFGMMMRGAASETHYSQAPLRGGQRQGAHGLHSVFAQVLQPAGKGSLFVEVIKNKRLLRFPNPSRGSFVGLKFRAQPGLARHRGFQNVQAHHVARGIVQDQVQIIEIHDAVQALGEVVKQFAQVAVLRNGFGNFEQRLVQHFRGSARQLARWNVIHEFENNKFCAPSLCGWNFASCDRSVR